MKYQKRSGMTETEKNEIKKLHKKYRRPFEEGIPDLLRLLAAQIEEKQVKIHEWHEFPKFKKKGKIKLEIVYENLWLS